MVIISISVLMKIFLYIGLLCIIGIRIAYSSNTVCTLKRIVTTKERILSHGYPTESHYVVTTDGYVLKLFRIPYSNKLNNKNKYRPSVLLQHGLLSNSDCWLSSGPDNSLAFLLVDAGYDVWLGNARGNIYSRNNTRLSQKNPKFWRFDWHEIGVIDIAAMIDYITEVTKQSQIHYIGHSQGTTVYFVLMSERPEYNSRIKSAHFLAPCVYFAHSNSFIFDLLRPLIGTPGSLWNRLFADMELLPQNEVVNRFADTFCGIDTEFHELCENIYLQLIGDSYWNTNITSLQTLIETHPGGGSSNQLIHFIQLSVSHQFRQFDWGFKKNMLVYGQSTPPNYDLSKATAPSYIYSSDKDNLCDIKNVDILATKLPNLKKHIRIRDPLFNHLSFILSIQIKKLINNPLILNIAKHEKSVFTHATL